MPDDSFFRRPGAEENKALNTEEKLAGKTVLRSRPVRISMNMTGKCNIRCIYCHLTYADYYTDRELPPETFRKMQAFFPTLSHLVYFASTEPLMARHFTEVFHESAPLAAEKYLSTNGIRMRDEIAEMFVTEGLDLLTISFGGMTRESFRRAHQVDQLNQVTANIEALNRVKDRHGSARPRMRLVFVTLRDNAHELPEAVRYAHRHRFEEGIRINYLMAYHDSLVDQIPYDHKEEVGKWVREAQRLGAELGVPVSFDGGNFDDEQDDGRDAIAGYHRPCYEPFERFHVEADGRVRTCSSPTNDVFAGDLNHQSAEDIWNGPVFQEFRRRVNTDDAPSQCRRCIFNRRKNFARRDIWDLRDLDLGIYRRLDGRTYLKGRRRRET